MARRAHTRYTNLHEFVCILDRNILFVNLEYDAFAADSTHKMDDL